MRSSITCLPSWESACRLPRRRKIDWLVAFVWLVVMPATAAAFWGGLGRWLWNHL